MGITLLRKGEMMNKKLLAALFIGMLFLSSGAAFATQFFNLVNVSNLPNQIDTEPAIAIDTNNKVHIAWDGFFARGGAPDGVASDVFYSTNKDGSFCPPIKISVPTGWYSREVTIAVDPSGNVHIAFRRSNNQTNLMAEDDIYYVTNTSGNFNNPLLLLDGGSYPADVGAPYLPRIHCDAQGHVHLTFLANWLNGSSMVVGYMNNVTNSWSAPMVAASGTSPSEPSSCLDKNGYIHIAYANMDFTPPDYPWRIYYTNNTSGSFKSPVAATPYETDSHEPDLAVDSKGNAHVVYREPFVHPGTPDLFYANNIGGSFGSGTPLCDANVYYLPSIAVDASDNIHISYKKFPAYDGALYYGNNINGGFSFVTCSLMNNYWYPGSRYFVLGKSGALHFAFYDWAEDVYGSDTEIYYLAGTMNEFTISGTITTASGGLNNVAINGLPGITTTDANGNYSVQVDVGWSGTATPLKEGYTFSPSSRTYSSVGTNQTNQNYSATLIQYTLTINSASGGTTSPSPGSHKYDYHTTASIRAIPDNHYLFIEWTGNVISNEKSNNPLSLYMDANKTITPSFRRNIYAVLNLNGTKILNRNLSKAEYINDLKWTANPDNANIQKYRIYLVNESNLSLLSEVSGNSFEYLHRKIEKNTSYEYAIVAVNDEGREGIPAYVSVR
jgi:hypothetical protein